MVCSCRNCGGGGGGGGYCGDVGACVGVPLVSCLVAATIPWCTPPLHVPLRLCLPRRLDGCTHHVSREPHRHEARPDGHQEAQSLQGARQRRREARPHCLPEVCLAELDGSPQDLGTLRDGLHYLRGQHRWTRVPSGEFQRFKEALRKLPYFVVGGCGRTVNHGEISFCCCGDCDGGDRKITSIVSRKFLRWLCSTVSQYIYIIMCFGVHSMGFMPSCTPRLG